MTHAASRLTNATQAINKISWVCIIICYRLLFLQLLHCLNGYYRGQAGEQASVR